MPSTISHPAFAVTAPHAGNSLPDLLHKLQHAKKHWKSHLHLRNMTVLMWRGSLCCLQCYISCLLYLLIVKLVQQTVILASMSCQCWLKAANCVSTLSACLSLWLISQTATSRSSFTADVWPLRSETNFYTPHPHSRYRNDRQHQCNSETE